MERYGPIKRFPSEPEAMRQSPRRLVHVPAIVANSGDGYLECFVDNLSREGCRVNLQCRFTEDTFLCLTFPGRGPIGTRVVWSDGMRTGLEFLHPLHIAVLDDLLRLFPLPLDPPPCEGVSLSSWHG